jgi:lactate dehydrogenase-like 2-hydroxyacid dehydrogenase
MFGDEVVDRQSRAKKHMQKPILVVTARYLAAVEQRLEQDFELRRNVTGGTLGRSELLNLADGADAMFVTPFDRLDAEFFKQVSSSVRVIATYSVGLDHIDLDAASARNIAIGYTPGVNADATAEIAMLLMLGAARRAYEAGQMLRSGAWPSNPQTFLGWQLTGKSLGILGMGRIGRAVGKRAEAFGMRVHYVNPSRLPSDVVGFATFHSTIEEMLPVCQFLSLHAPQTDATRQIINGRTLPMLPRGAILINTARGGLVDDTAVIAALKSGQLAAAGLDVYESEPNVHPGYLQLANVFLLPHIGSATVETRTAMGMLCLDTIEAILQGRIAPALVECNKITK